MPAIDCDIHCTGCGASLKGIDSRGTCSGCGGNVAITLHRSAVRVEDLTLRGHITCLRCGYDLRTLPAASRCPECARPIVESLRGEYLHSASPNWLKTIRDGVSAVRTGIVGIVGVQVLLVAFAFIQFTLLPWSVARAVMGPGYACLGAALITFYIFLVLGVVRCAVLDPKPTTETSTAIAGWGGMALVLSPFLAFFLAAGRVVPEPFLIPILALGLALSVACVFVCLRPLADRSGHTRLSRRSTFIIRLTIVCVAAGFAAPAAAWHLTGSDLAARIRLFGIVFVALCFIPATVLSCLALTEYRRLLNSAISGHRPG